MHARSRDSSLGRAGLAVLTLLVASGAHADGPPTVKLELQANGAITTQLPASGAFFATQTFTTTVDEARLEVWPLAEERCDAEVPFPEGKKQAWSLSMELASAEGKTQAKALVPHLQLGESFCFRLRWTELSAPSTARIEAAVQHAFDWSLDTTESATAIVRATQQDFCGAPGKDACAPVDIAALTDELRPFRLEGLEVTTERNAAIERKKLLADELARHEAKLPRTPKELEDELPSKKWLSGAPDIDAALELLGTAKVKTQLGPDGVTKHLAWLTEWKALMARKTAMNAAMAKDDAEWTAKETVTNERARDAALAFVRKKVRALHRTVTTGTAATGDFKNYVSPELGVAVAQLFGPVGAGTTPRLLPYAAVNVYLRPVERTLGLSEVVNPVWQLVSFTVGLSLSNSLAADDIDLGPTIAGAYALAGVGIRVLPFARFSVLAFFTEAKRSSGLSTDSRLVVAGALALSADLDVVAFISTQLKK